MGHHLCTLESDDDSSPTKRRKKDFYAPLRKQKAVSENDEVKQFFKEPVGSLTTLRSFPTMTKIFKYGYPVWPPNTIHLIVNLHRRYNTALPSSGAVERSFSTAGNIFTPKRSSLSDKHFEMLLFMKMNNAVTKW